MLSASLTLDLSGSLDLLVKASRTLGLPRSDTRAASVALPGTRSPIASVAVLVLSSPRWENRPLKDAGIVFGLSFHGYSGAVGI